MHGNSIVVWLFQQRILPLGYKSIPIFPIMNHEEEEEEEEPHNDVLMSTDPLVAPPEEVEPVTPVRQRASLQIQSAEGAQEEEEDNNKELFVTTPASASTFFEDEIIPTRPSGQSSRSSSSSSSSADDDDDDDDSTSIPRTDYGTVGRHLRRRLHVGRRRNNANQSRMRQALQRLRRSRDGSKRLRRTLPPIVARTPVLRRNTTGGSISNTASNTNQDAVPPSHRSTKSTTGASTLTNNIVGARSDHLRRLAFRRLIQSGLVWERLDDANTSPQPQKQQQATMSPESPSSEDDELDIFENNDDTAATFQGMDILIAAPDHQSIMRETPAPTCIDNVGEKAKEPDALPPLDVVGLAPEGLTPLREDSVVSTSDAATKTTATTTKKAALPKVPPKLDRLVASLSTETPPRTATTPVASNTTATSSSKPPPPPLAKPSLLKRVSSLSSIASGKFGSAHSSITGDDLDEDAAYLLGATAGSRDYAMDPLLQIDEDEEERWLEEIRQEILQEERTSSISNNLQSIQKVLKEYAVLYPTSSSRHTNLLSKGKLECDLEDDTFDGLMEEYPVQVRLQNVTYQVKQAVNGGNKIPTVYNTSLVYPIYKGWKRYCKEGWRAAWHQMFGKPEYETVDILSDIDLVLQPGRSYLVLGPPGSGKTSLLKVIAGRLRPDIRQQWPLSAADDSFSVLQDQTNESFHGSVMTGAGEPCDVPDKPCTILQGRIKYNGRTIPEGGKEFFIENAMVYIDQLDQHAARLTVDETFEFAFQCKTGGNMFRDVFPTNETMYVYWAFYSH